MMIQLGPREPKNLKMHMVDRESETRQRKRDDAYGGRGACNGGVCAICDEGDAGKRGGRL